MNKDDETLLATLRYLLERNEKTGDVSAIYNPNGPFKIVQPPTSGLVRYFIPAYVEGIDEYGNPFSSLND